MPDEVLVGVPLILSALATGVAAGVTDFAKQSVVESGSDLADAMRRLLARIHHHFDSDPISLAALTLFQDDSESTAIVEKLGEQLERKNVHEDLEATESAREVLFSTMNSASPGDDTIVAHVVRIWADRGSVATGVIRGNIEITNTF